MDPLTAIGLASNILSFIDFSSNLVRDAAKIYQSASGLPEELEDVAIITGNLESHMGRLSPPALSPSASPDDKALATLVGNCQKTCGELRQLVERIKGKGVGSRRDSFRVAWRSLRGKGKLEELEKRIEKYQTQILGQLLVRLRDENREQHTQVESHQSTEKVEAMEMKQDIREIREKVLKLVHSQARIGQATSANGASTSYDEILQDIRRTVSDLSARMRIISAERQISDLLWFPELRLRFGSIDEAHRGTYRWLLYDPDDDFEQDTYMLSRPPSPSSYGPEQSSVTSQQSDDQPPVVEASDSLGKDSDRYSTISSTRSDPEKIQRQAWRGQFLDWLQNGSGLFYVSGNPGSGKSTLLKYISQDSLTRQTLEAWASRDAQDIIQVRFFFWSSGAKLQRTIEGLHRSILWEVLQSRPDLTQQIFPNLWARACEGSIHESDLTKETLQAAFQVLVYNQELLGKQKVCIFIDGLDECEEDHWQLTKELKRWCAAPDVKLCVSSRPHNEFLQAFTPKTGAWLKLHELNREDILKVIHDQFAGDERFVEARQLSTNSTDYDDLTHSIAQKAEGVFIWVIMVIRSLLQGIGNFCSLSQLRKRLDAIPAEVNSMFQYMLAGIDQLERQAAARTFLVMKLGHTAFDPKTWVYIHSVLDNLNDDPEYERSLLDGTPQPCSEGRYGTSACVSMAHRLNWRCRGLVQVIFTGNYFPYCHQVQFIHRTFSDFLDEPKTVQELSTMAVGFSPYRSVALGLLATMKHIPRKEWEVHCQGYRSTQAFGDTGRQETNSWSRVGQLSMHRALLDIAACIELAESCLITAEIESMKQMTLQLWTSDDFIRPFNSQRRQIQWSITDLQSNEREIVVLLFAVGYGAFEYVKSMMRNHSLDTKVCSQLLLVSSSETVTGPIRRAPLENTVAMSWFLLEFHASLNFELQNICFLGESQNDGTSINQITQHLSSPLWTPWTAFLMEIAQTWVIWQEHDTTPKWIRLLELYFEYGCDATVCFVGYNVPQTKKGPLWGANGRNQILEDLANEETNTLENILEPLYADLPTMLEIWDLGVSLPPRTWLSKNFPAPRKLLGGWLGMLSSGSGQFRKVGSDEIQRWDFLVLRVVSHHKLKDVERSDLDDIMRQVLDRVGARIP
ncbi:hypothetical protein CKAH01_03512 [Colletotrichum kahawae]|uniref:NACHT domain-containing protein n=1 Tax=Colletotrichum kahawae TaxID=34407 RepID=A0AAD9YSN8_COLKA|nr:hypothetical protein CKAH01_03512 [Colletotrichum kahawae]